MGDGGGPDGDSAGSARHSRPAVLAVSRVIPPPPPPPPFTITDAPAHGVRHLVADEPPLHAVAGPYVAVQHHPRAQPHPRLQRRVPRRRPPRPQRGEAPLLLEGGGAGRECVVRHIVGGVPEGLPPRAENKISEL